MPRQGRGEAAGSSLHPRTPVTHRPDGVTAAAALVRWAIGGAVGWVGLLVLLGTVYSPIHRGRGPCRTRCAGGRA